MTTDILDFTEVTAYAGRLRRAAATIPAAVSVIWDTGRNIEKELNLVAPEGATRKLKDSIFLRSSGYEGHVLVGVHKFYARYYEDGTSRQPPRPFFRPTVAKHITLMRPRLAAEMINRLRVKDISVGVNKTRRVRAGERWRLAGRGDSLASIRDRDTGFVDQSLALGRRT